MKFFPSSPKEPIPDAFLPSRVFRHAGRGGGLCRSHFGGLPPTPGSIHVEERPRCASAEQEVPKPIRELIVQRWRPGVRAGPARTVRRWKVRRDAVCCHPEVRRVATRE